MFSFELRFRPTGRVPRRPFARISPGPLGDWGEPMRVASVIAANGTGHFRRSIGVLHRLLIERPSLDLTVFCTDRQLKVMQSWWRLRNLVELGARFITDFECGVRWPLVQPVPDLLAWRDQLAESSEIRDADLVVSDNLANILTIRPDVVLMGSFLWSEVLAQTDHPEVRRFVDDELGCLGMYRPPMLCVAGIATRGVLRETDAVQLDWMCEEPAPQPRTLSTPPTIGICAGTTDAAADQVAQLLRLLVPQHDVLVDALPKAVSMPNVRSGLLRDIPLNVADIVLCRPGAGTVMDCIAANTPFVTFAEPQSPEMTHTASRLAALGIAETLTCPLSEDDVLSVVNNIAGPQVYAASSAKLHALSKGGLDQAARWLVERVTTVMSG
jgi:hypothetical protein